MKKTLLINLFICLSAISMFAQDDGEEERGFKKQNLFTGGSITLSFFNNQTVIGANPIFGYKLTNWADAGVSFNFLYSGYRDYYQYDDKMKQSVFGPGVFVRLYPVKFLFVEGQAEHSFTTLKYIPSPGSSLQEDKTSTDVNSLLVGGGLATGREKGATTFYYISILFDVLKNVNSPYVNVSYNPDNPSQQRVTMAPIIRAGVNIGLFQNKYQ
jgi:hypothetical protein